MVQANRCGFETKHRQIHFLICWKGRVNDKHQTGMAEKPRKGMQIVTSDKEHRLTDSQERTGKSLGYSHDVHVCEKATCKLSDLRSLLSNSTRLNTAEASYHPGGARLPSFYYEDSSASKSCRRHYKGYNGSGEKMAVRRVMLRRQNPHFTFPKYSPS
ncbi:uncharacterized protein LOC111265918 [Varroa jacobsoni]|uniref:uncharacterized protein LOC111265918 n=1 Tax=Varroa jacobsoni TaxID=62625 RepID=UPI000BF33599|nr:uncharacterized protein LOC111265918 [Varroa jacobsoni]